MRQASDNAAEIADAVEEFLTGSRAPVTVDRVLATVLFTDIVDSTEKAASLGDRRWRDLLDAHDKAIRAELTRFRGREVKSLGDGFLATFDGPARAIHCAQSIIAALRPLGIAIRAGIHTGEVEIADDDIRGIAVHITSRVAALGKCRQYCRLAHD
jgi:class 3 adenylate cyclase